MMLKNDNPDKLVRKLKKSVRELCLDLQAITEEHDRYVPKGSQEEIIEWFHSLPIETLLESINREHNLPRTKYSLCDIKHKFALRKLHEKKKEELEQKQIELNIAKIDCVLSKIQGIENGHSEGSTGRKRSSRQKVGRSKSR